jgi:hypothetical protein
MQITINGVPLTITATQTSTCPAGTAYWQVEYRRTGDQLPCYIICTGAIYGRPDALAMLDATHELNESILPADVDPAVARSATVYESGQPDHVTHLWRETHRATLLRRVAMLTD